MSAVDHWLAGLGSGGGLVGVLLVAGLLGLRHAADPDHLTALATLTARGRGRGALALALAWGGGHAASVVAFGLPIVLWRAYLPVSLRSAAEVAIGLLTATFALRLLLDRHSHRPLRTPRTAFGIGLLQGLGGSAAIGILLLSTIPNRTVAVVALLLFASGTVVSIVALSGGLGRVLARVPELWLRYGLGSASMLFGLGYALQASPLHL